MTAIATIASIPMPTGDTRKARKLFGNGCTWNSTAESVEASWRFVQVAEFDVVLLGWRVSAGTTIFTWLLESEPPISVKFTPGVGLLPIVWKSPGIVKLVLLPNVWGFSTSPLRLVEEVPALRSRSLVVDIWLIMIEVALMNTNEAGAVLAGNTASSGWRYCVFSLFT